ncbi:CDP-diacylglycerol pyrophosphatase [Paramixta manurensis]|uniref:CDP-diacylglycerol pyrophosphatase n=1 Tax=Paramixta manurensis TaxID=2740817 RepID=A0A6M8UE51_9GAMM|nr:CDP-diacylglycerol pyrophosphatase [Erwiniaceae bacterium PD-1]
MRERPRVLKLIVVLIAILVIGLATAAYRVHKNADALWQIISQKCVPGQRQGNPAPCQRVDMAQGYVILKDLVGPLQYLLMPIDKITGMESPRILDPQTPNFFAEAWQQRSLLAQRHGTAIADSALSLAINSKYGRTQNQLHIHISCLRRDIRQRLDTLTPALNTRWQAEKLGSHTYLVRTLSAEELAQQSSFIRLADEVPHARGEMGKYGMALARLPDGRLALMAIESHWLKLNRGSAEELQDHQCAILN